MTKLSIKILNQFELQQRFKHDET